MIFPRLDDGKAVAVGVFKQTQIAFEDTAAFDEVNGELAVSVCTACIITAGLYYLYRLNWRLCVTREGMKTTKHISKR